MKKISISLLALCLSFACLLCGCTLFDQYEEESVIIIEQIRTTTAASKDAATTNTSTATTVATTKASAATTTTTAAATTTSAPATTTTTFNFPSGEAMIQELKGLNVLAIGDSLFRGHAETIGEKVWVNRMAIQCNWNITNLGIGGMTMSLTAANEINNRRSIYDKLFNTTEFVYGTSTSTYYQYGNTQKTPEEVDVIILEGGCNDFAKINSVPLGTVDSKDYGTFLGAWNLVTEKLMKDYPNAAIIFLTTWELDWTDRPDGISSMQYSTSVKTLYEANYAFRKRITLIDMGNPAVSGANMIDKNWRNEYAYDRFHLKENGMNIVCTNMLPHIWKALKETGTI